MPAAMSRGVIVVLLRAAWIAWTVVCPVLDGRSGLRRRWYHQCLTWADVGNVVLAAILASTAIMVTAWGLRGLIVLIKVVRTAVIAFRVLMAL